MSTGTNEPSVASGHFGHRECRPDLMLDGICADCQRPHFCGAGCPIEFEKIEYHFPDRYYVGKTGERQEMRLVTVPEYAWTCERCPARGIDYETERGALDAVLRHQQAAHPRRGRSAQVPS